MSKRDRSAQRPSRRQQAEAQASEAETPTTVTETQAAVEAKVETDTQDEVATPAPVASAPEVEDVVDATNPSTDTKATSVRKLINGMLQAGRSTKEIEAALKEQFPNTMAAAKSSKHISHYRCLLKKAAKAQQAEAKAS
jgi:hypothetical protein